MEIKLLLFEDTLNKYVELYWGKSKVSDLSESEYECLTNELAEFLEDKLNARIDMWR